ncbi:MAG: deoxyhypusine synthase [Methanomicrobiales archaeon]
MKPTQPVAPEREVDRLLARMSQGGFQGRTLGESVDIWARMIEDGSCTIFLGLAGAMVPAGMQACLIELVDRGYVDVIVSTGANLFHDACEHLGIRHYQGAHHADDAALYRDGIDRIYDVYAYESEFRDVDRALADFAAEIEPFSGSSREFFDRLAPWLDRRAPAGRSVLSACSRRGVPVFAPALADSSIGIGLVLARHRGIPVHVDQIADAVELTDLVGERERTGVVYIGGGVPKNFIQQTQVIASLLGSEGEGHDYAVQYTTDAPHFGGLSGCSFEEAISWGKERPDSPHVQCFCDATIALPLAVSALVGKGVRRAGEPL